MGAMCSRAIKTLNPGPWVLPWHCQLRAREAVRAPSLEGSERHSETLLPSLAGVSGTGPPRPLRGQSHGWAPQG